MCRLWFRLRSILRNSHPPRRTARLPSARHSGKASAGACNTPPTNNHNQRSQLTGDRSNNKLPVGPTGENTPQTTPSPQGVLERPYTVGGRGVPPPGHLADSKIFGLRKFKLKKISPAFSGDYRGTLGGGGSQPNPPPPPPLQTLPSTPSNTSLPPPPTKSPHPTLPDPPTPPRNWEPCITGALR